VPHFGMLFISMRKENKMVENSLIPAISTLIFILGLSIGAFLNVVAERVSAGERIDGRSHCDYCKKTLNWFDLIPLFSYCSTGGRCRYCKKKLSIQYSTVELITGLFFLVSFVRNNFLLDVHLLAVFIIVSCSIVILITDIKWQIILDEALVPLFFVGLCISSSQLPFYLGGSLIITVLFLFIHLLSSGQAMGYADIKLVFVMGFLLTIPHLFFSLYIGFLTGGVVSVILLIGRLKGLRSRIALGPFLVIGLLVMLWI
jgi:leader peptidase (prepilin peptidase) / N-methyltransferase